MGWFLAITAGIFLIYLLTLSRHYSADSLLYALEIDRAIPRYLLDPTHVLLHPLGWAWYQPWWLAGWRQGSILPLQILNALGGAFCAGLLYAITRAVARSPRLAALVALGFAASGGLWLLSVEAEFVTVPVALMLLVLWLLLAPPIDELRDSYALLLGLAVTLACLGYLNSVFLVPVVIAGLWMRPGLSQAKRGRQIGIFLAVVVLIMLPASVAALLIWSRGEWARLVALGGGGVYGQIRLFNLPHGGYAFFRSLALYRGLGMNGSTRDYLAEATSTEQLIFIVYYGLVFLISTFPLIVGFRRRKMLLQTYRWQLVVLAVWTALFAAFAFWWVPGDISFWLPLLAAWWLFFGLVLSTSGYQASRLARMTLAAAVMLLALVNLFMVIGPRRDLASNQAYQLATDVAANTAPEDLIITNDGELAALYVLYFGRRRTFHITELPDTLDELPPDMQTQLVWLAERGGKAYILHDGRLKVLPE